MMRALKSEGANPIPSTILNTGGDRIKMWDTHLTKKKKDP